MKKPEVIIDWSVAEDEHAWQAGHSVPDSPAMPEGGMRAAKRGEWVVAVLAALLLLGLIGGWMWRGQHMAAATSNELQRAIIQEAVAGAGKGSSKEADAQRQTPFSLAGAVKIESYVRSGDKIMAQVIAPYLIDGEMRPYRQTRFYQRRGDQWQRIDPDPQLLGPAKTLEIANLTIHYQAVDAEALYAAAPKLAEFYLKVRRDVGLPLATQPYSGSLEVTIGGIQPIDAASFATRTVSVSSPALLSAPAEMERGAILYQALVYPVALQALYELTRQHPQPWQRTFLHWFPIQRAFPLWEMWKDNGPLAAGRVEAIHWLYQEQGGVRQPLPQGYERLCQTYRIWQSVPWRLYIPLACNERDGALTSDGRFADLTLHWNLRPHPTGEGKTISQNPLSSTVMVATILDYVAATYGESKVPELLNALGQSPSLDTLIPALFGLSVADFEAGWQAYLAQRY